jgi:hypothetical protein
MKAKPVPQLDVEQTTRFWAKVQKQSRDACWFWTANVNNKGYGLFKVGNRMVSTHRIAYLLGTGVQPNELHVLHSCDIKRCCNPRHLFMGTNQDNCDDYAAKGLSPNLGHDQVGEQNGNARLTEHDVRVIRASSDIQRVTAARFGITQVMVSRIKLRKAWAHV